MKIFSLILHKLLIGAFSFLQNEMFTGIRNADAHCKYVLYQKIPMALSHSLKIHKAFFRAHRPTLKYSNSQQRWKCVVQNILIGS